MTKTVPVGVSNRHVHLTDEHVAILFGYPSLTKMRDLIQPSVFAAEETVTVVGSKGSIDRVRVLGPTRKETQVEILMADSFKLGIVPDMRLSGDLKGTPGCTLIGPAGQITIEYGVIIALRHLHIGEDDAVVYGLRDGDRVSVRVPGKRAGVLHEVIVRAGRAHQLELHIDTEEANALGVKSGDQLELVESVR